MIGAPKDPFLITPDQKSKYEAQFFRLSPVNGLITGEQAKGLFLKSGLSPQILAKIWELSDIDADGRMDVNEFSIALHLIALKLKGIDPPLTLPQSLKCLVEVPKFDAFGMSSAASSIPMTMGIPIQTMPAVGAPVPPTAPTYFPPGLDSVSTSVPPGRPPPPRSFDALNSSMPAPTAAINTITSSIMSTSQQSSQAGVIMDSAKLQRAGSITSGDYPASVMLTEWAIPQPSKLKYTQLFNTHDRTRTGFLTGPQARNILLQSGLPQQTLAQIWNLSDIDTDGRLTCEEFVLAMHLIDSVKAGDALPGVLPVDLIPPSQRRKRSLSGSNPVPPVAAVPSGDLMGPVPEEMNLSQSGLGKGMTTFEDKRRENFEKGQAELDRRRQMLLDQQKRERQERERKEREEADKRERIRLEQEARRQQELEKQIQRQKEVEAEKEEQRRKLLEQRESARREMERQRMLEWENQRKQELLLQKQKLQETISQLKSRKTNLIIEVEKVNNQFNEAQEQAEEARRKVTDAKGEIDKMRLERDSKLKDINFLKSQMKALQDRQLIIEQEKLNLTTQLKNVNLPVMQNVSDSTQFAVQSKQLTINQLKSQLEDAEKDLQQKKQDLENNNTQFTELKTTVEEIMSRTKVLQNSYNQKREEAVKNKEKLQETTAAPATQDFQAAWPASADWGASEKPTTTVSYKALFAFEARNEDELSIEVGDTVTIIPQSDAETGWLKGQIGNRVGWFPEAYVEKIEADTFVQESEQQAENGFNANFEDAKDAFKASEESSFFPTEKANNQVISQEVPQSYSVVKAVALYPWKAKEDNHLSFNKGDMIVVKEQQDMWWCGELGDSTGWFPKSYVKPVAGGISGTVEDMEPEYYVSLYPFETEEPGDLRFDAAELIRVTKKEGEWWTGEISSERIGIFPSNYVREAQPEEVKSKLKKPEIVKVIAPYKSTGPEQLDLEKGQLIQVRKKNTSGWWEGEIQVKGRKRQIGWFPASYVKSLNPANSGSGGSSARSTPDPMKSEPECEKVIALYAFVAQHSDELNFETDEIIKVLSKDDATWWKGQSLTSGAVGLFPSNHVQPYKEKRSPESAFFGSHINGSLIEENASHSLRTKRQNLIQEFISTEEIYVRDLEIVLQIYQGPLLDSGALTVHEFESIFLNWKDLIRCNKKFLKALKAVRRQSLRASEAGEIEVIADAFCEFIPKMEPVYTKFCSRQLASAKLLQMKSKTDANFVEVVRQCSQDPRTNRLPLSTYFMKPVQRITKYKMLIEKILKSTSQEHPDYSNSIQALTHAQYLCDKTNEACERRENEEHLDWITQHVKCDALDQVIDFNSPTNFLGPRKLVHYGYLVKVNSNKELIGFLFNDFLLLTVSLKEIGRVTNVFVSEKALATKYHLYKKPLLLSDIEIISSHNHLFSPSSGTPANFPEPISNSPEPLEFTIGVRSLSRTLTFRALSVTDKANWIKHLVTCRSIYLEQEAKININPRRLASGVGIGRLLVSIIEAEHLNSKNPVIYAFCIASIGSALKHQEDHDEINVTKAVRCLSSVPSPVDTHGGRRRSFTAKWCNSTQFYIKRELSDDYVLVVSCYEKNFFAPNQFFGKVVLRLKDIAEEVKQVPAGLSRSYKLQNDGVIYLKLDLHFFEE